MDKAIAIALHTTLTHLDKSNAYVSMLFIDYSSAFNTILPSKLTKKATALGLNSSLCHLVLDFLTGRAQVVKVGNITSSTLILNTGAPQECVPLYTNCVASHNSISIIKLADDMTVVGLITNNNEKAYREEVGTLDGMGQGKQPRLNVGKTKELIVDFRSNQSGHAPILNNRAGVETIKNFLGVSHFGEAEMVKPHGHRGEEGTTVTLQPQVPEEIRPVPEGPRCSTGAPSREYCRAASQPGTATPPTLTARLYRR